MTEATETAKTKKKRIITFIYATEATEGPRIATVSSEVTESHISTAWRRLARDGGLKGNAFLGAIAGDKQLLEDQLRKPSYKELEEKIAALQMQQQG